MKLSASSHLPVISEELEKPQGKNVSITRKLVQPLITFWQFSYYYGNFVAYRR